MPHKHCRSSSEDDQSSSEQSLSRQSKPSKQARLDNDNNAKNVDKNDENVSDTNSHPSSPPDDSADPQEDPSPHRYQAQSTTHREEDQWKFRPPYQLHTSPSPFPAQWTGQCHCGKVQYQLSRARPLASKYCHCTTCQRLHGAPFQWAAIFHKTDINFTRGHHDLGWYDPSSQSTTHHLPCKVQCAYCRTPIMDEGRNMILLFPTLLEGINTPAGREAFRVKSHMFYPQRVVDLRDGVQKWAGLEGKSKRLDEDGEEMEGEGKNEDEDKENGEGEEEGEGEVVDGSENE